MCDFMPHKSVITYLFNHIINRGHKIRVLERRPLTCMPQFHLRSSLPHPKTKKITHRKKVLSAGKELVRLSDGPSQASSTDGFIGSLIFSLEHRGFKSSLPE